MGHCPKTLALLEHMTDLYPSALFTEGMKCPYSKVYELELPPSNPSFTEPTQTSD